MLGTDSKSQFSSRDGRCQNIVEIAHMKHQLMFHIIAVKANGAPVQNSVNLYLNWAVRSISGSELQTMRNGVYYNQ